MLVRWGCLCATCGGREYPKSPVLKVCDLPSAVQREHLISGLRSASDGSLTNQKDDTFLSLSSFCRFMYGRVVNSIHYCEEKSLKIC